MAGVGYGGSSGTAVVGGCGGAVMTDIWTLPYDIPADHLATWNVQKQIVIVTLPWKQ